MDLLKTYLVVSSSFFILALGAGLIERLNSYLPKLGIWGEDWDAAMIRFYFVMIWMAYTLLSIFRACSGEF